MVARRNQPKTIYSKVKRISLYPQHGDRVRFFADISSEALRRVSEVGHTTTSIEVRLKGEADRADQYPALQPRRLNLERRASDL